MVHITFKGKFTFVDSSLLQNAQKEVNDFIIDRDKYTLPAEKSIGQTWNESCKIDGLTFWVDINTECPENQILTYEDLIETLASYAIEGKVTEQRSDHPEWGEEIYEAEGD